MNWLAELLPLFVIRWYCHKYLSRSKVGDMIVANPRKGVFVEVKRTCSHCRGTGHIDGVIGD